MTVLPGKAIQPFLLNDFHNLPARSGSTFRLPYDLYLLRCEHFIKIGIAADTEKRRADLQRSNPFAVSVLWQHRFEAKAFAMIAELGVHQMLLEHRHAGEWFTASPEEAMSAISAIMAEMPAVIERQLALQQERKARRNARTPPIGYGLTPA